MPFSSVPTFDTKRYRQINDSFDNPFVFTLTNRGFFSEVNNLLNAIAFGLITKRRLLVDQTPFGGMKWNDFFDADLPPRGALHVDREWIITHVGSRHFATIRDEISGMWERRERFDFPSFDIKNVDIFSLRRILSHAFCGERQVRIFGHPMFATRNCAGPRPVQWRKVDLRPREFVAIHVRRGDKIEGEYPNDGSGRGSPEGEMTPVSTYTDLIRRHAPTASTIFVITDDYVAVEELRYLAPKLRLRTLCPKSAAGYRNREFLGRPRAERIQAIERLLTEVRIASQSSLFVGPYKANPSRFVANIHWDPARCVSVDALREWTPL